MSHSKRLITLKAARRLSLLLCSAIALWGALAPRPGVAAPVTPLQFNPAVSGQWSSPNWVGFIPIHMSLLPNGKVLMWGRDIETDEFGVERDADNYSWSYIYDPATGGFDYAFNPTTNLFCAGHAFLPDGRLFVAGGHDRFDGRGEPHTNFYDYTTNSYTFGPAMNAGRWYPSVCALGNGETLIASGNDQSGQRNVLPQVLQTNQTLRDLGGATDVTQPLYPMSFLAPNSRVFMAGPESDTRYLSTAGAGDWIDPAINRPGGSRDHGSAVMYEDGKVLVMGGGAPTNTAQTINLSRENVWQPTGSMQFPRNQLNATLLPDGKVLATGGTEVGFSNPSAAVYAAEMWNPDTGGWTTLASASRPRLYHSTAVLLPDGRVLTGGGGGLRPPDHSQDEPTIEFYSPPYLFGGPRPAITFAPSVVNHGDQIFVGTPDAADISKVTLVRLSSVTHAFNENQRINTLWFRRESNGLTVKMPGSGNVSPPGHYMMFILNSNGVPSVASMIQLTVPPSPSNAIDDQRYFVRQQYYDLLNREPDAGGWNGWMSYINQCGTDPACLTDRRVVASMGFIDSSEFRRDKPALTYPGTPEYNQEFVRQCYLVYLRREPDPGGYNAWLNYLNNTNDEYGVVHGFIYSGEYRNRFYKP